MLTLQQFLKLFPNANSQIYNSLVTNMLQNNIIGGNRANYFLAQIAHETCGFRYTTELGNKAYFTRYDGRKDLGNTQPGDGCKYRGRGYIQLTGRNNYTKYGLQDTPDLAATPDYAANIACQYWVNNGCNQLADKSDFNAVTKKINGGLNGLSDRLLWLHKIQQENN